LKKGAKREIEALGAEDDVGTKSRLALIIEDGSGDGAEPGELERHRRDVSVALDLGTSLHDVLLPNGFASEWI
jgi:hypothetical protein